MSVTHRSLSIAPEGSSFGSLDSTTGLPSTSGLTFISIPCERDHRETILLRMDEVLT